MIHKVEIKNNKRTPISYLSEIKAFKNGRVFEFKEGVNIIVGENGCGKSTLLRLICAYLLVDSRDCGVGQFNSNINNLFTTIIDGKLLDGVGVYADYVRNTCRLVHATEKKEDDIYCDISTFFSQTHSSTGEGVSIALGSMFDYVFSGKAPLTFDYGKLKGQYPQYYKYIGKHIQKGEEWTFVMDEPDRNLSISKVLELKNILSFHKQRTQIIAVVHNPLLIVALSKCKDVNIIEMTDGYVEKVTKAVKKLIK